MFKITKRHYDIIIKQAQTNHPQECGGFLGGKDLTISAILPTFNAHLYNKTDTFAVTSEDILRAHEFFDKHGLEYFGIYHTHPKASATPSDQDLRNVQRFMFIISLQNFDFPDFAAYEVNGKEYKRLPLSVLTKEADVVDIHGGQKAQDVAAQNARSGNDGRIILPKKTAPRTKAGDLIQEMNRMNDMFNQYITEDKISYPKLKKPRKGDDGFSTLA
jgi:proteasome lid subunit RPN8/RPN11